MNIFVVQTFAPLDVKTMSAAVHYVVGKDSQDAQARITQLHPDHLSGRRFIYTDAFVEQCPCVTQMYANERTPESTIAVDEFYSWLEMHTKPDDAGIASFREF